MAHFIDPHARTGRSDPKHYKTTLVRSDRLMLGLNCLEPGQSQRVHTHEGQDKFYLVLEGDGEFTVGGERRREGAHSLVWAPAGVEHGVENTGRERLVIFMGMAPAPPE